MANTEAAASNAPVAGAANAAVVVRTLCICTVYILTSAILIRFNKHMMHKDRFPFATALSAIHMLFGTVCCNVLYQIAPSMFPALAKTEGQRLALARWFFPIGACFAVMLWGSNTAYIYCSVTVLQFMKEANVMIVFLMSCLVGLQQITRVRVALIFWVIAGASVSVTGDLKFSLIGIGVQALSQLAECARVVMGEIVLREHKFDPLSYTFFLAPVCLLVLAVATAASWDHRIVPAFLAHWPLLTANATVAFALNLLVATVIKETSAVGFVLTGLLKDVMIVVLSCILFREPITRIQVMAFAMTLGGVGVWSLLKISPRSAPVRLLERALCAGDAEEAEKAPILPEKAAAVPEKV